MIRRGKLYKVVQGSHDIDKTLLGIYFRPLEFHGLEKYWLGEAPTGRPLYFYEDELEPLEDEKEDKEYLDLFV